VPGTPQMLDSLGEAHVVVDLLDTLEVVAVISDNKPIEGFKGHLKKEDDPEEHQKIDEVLED